MQYGLDFFYLLIPNYGVAIILLTLLTKVVFLPLTFRSSESMAKMAELNPKMTEIRTRLKDKPEKMNQEIAELYKKEKINPLSGCLPLLLQIPVFFALYNLLNSQFELRGASFIAGWVVDLSAPDTVLNFPFTVPLLGWTALRALPILMVVSQLFSSKITRPASAQQQQGGAQAKLMMYALPIVVLLHPLRHAVRARAVLDRAEHLLDDPAAVHQLVQEAQRRGDPAGPCPREVGEQAGQQDRAQAGQMSIPSPRRLT